MQTLEERTGKAIGVYIHVGRDSTLQPFKSDQRELEAMVYANSSGGRAEGLCRLSKMLEPEPSRECGSNMLHSMQHRHVLHVHVCVHRLQGGGAKAAWAG